jgi:hypothetical protein
MGNAILKNQQTTFNVTLLEETQMFTICKLSLLIF